MPARIPPAEAPAARVAYFSMELALDPAMPTYAGGLGVLAGDTVRSAADLALPMVAVTLLHRRGYFEQRLDPRGEQLEVPVAWPVEQRLEPLAPRVDVVIDGRRVSIRAWRRDVMGATRARVPVYFLDTDVPDNDAADRTLTDLLYGGDLAYRLRQEVVLGLGGVAMLRALGHDALVRFHLNEGHAALVALALLEDAVSPAAVDAMPDARAIEAVRAQCVFTTHTPVPAGHDQFPAELAQRVLGARRWAWLRALGVEGTLNMTELALRAARFVNGVAMRHGEVSKTMFPGYPIRAITNGVHAGTWVAPSFQALYDRHLPEWRRDALSLRYAIGIGGAEIWEAHRLTKRALLDEVQRRARVRLDEHVITLGFARRATAYKRATLLFRDLARLRALVEHGGGLQVVFAGKAHPRDEAGKALIRRIHEARDALGDRVPVVYLENYDVDLARLVCAGVDVWLNTPRPPLEASGTSGMKAALNGVPSLSVLDGWWIEGHIENVTGWAIGGPAPPSDEEAADAADAAALYDALATAVLPCFYGERDRFISIMRYAIAVNGAFFNSQRMVAQYAHNAYAL
ncbi:MAG: alpha-glucan family phosphorylase [Candidatus Rokubacteria bacterium]|nr:alpha-glucan family phosphorylase [Candidatus Rokubacteria bacterium]